MNSSGTITVPPIELTDGQLDALLERARATSTVSPPAITLGGVMSNAVVKLLAGVVVALALAYIGVIVTRVDNRIESLEQGQAVDDSRLDELETYRAVHEDFHTRDEKSRDKTRADWQRAQNARDAKYSADRDAWLEGMRAIGPKRRR